MGFRNQIFTIKTAKQFEELALKVFHFQAINNLVYKEFLYHLKIKPSDITSVNEIPFLPIQFFKSHQVITEGKPAEIIFTSSGTTGAMTSKHYVTDLKLYEESYLKGFENFYGSIEDVVVLALLPSYLERTGSSLIYMVEDLINKSKRSESGFYLNNRKDLVDKLINLDKKNQKVLLIGVSFALLDLVDQFQLSLKNTIVMETGGMKGRRKEMIRRELHDILKCGFNISQIHSEYGMTELLSQAYSDGNGVFRCPPWMRIKIRDTEDPLSTLENGRTGGVNVIDLANINSCSFIATQDLGKQIGSNEFEIMGRFDHSDIRGCNLLL